MYVSVLTSAASWQKEEPLLTYLAPSELEHMLRPGQLVAVPYGERLVEGIAWRTSEELGGEGEWEEQELRPLSAILDAEPALLPHQRALAEWMCAHYVTPLAQVAFMMLPPGLMQRSQLVLRLSKGEEAEPGGASQEASPRLQALIGLLLAEETVDIERLKKMLGPKRSKEVLKEARSSGLIQREAQLAAPRAKKRMRRVVRLVAEGETLAAWRERAEADVGARYITPVGSDARRSSKQTPDPWALPTPTNSIATFAPRQGPERATVLAQRQLAAIDLLERASKARERSANWSPTRLCKASGLTMAQLQGLVREQVVALEEIEEQRNPLQDYTIPASKALDLTQAQSSALKRILEALEADGAPSPILLHGVTGSGKTEVYMQALEAVIARGKRAIVLAPEIALTTQAVLRFAGRFPGRVAIIHGNLSLGERYDEWRRIRSGQAHIVIGARSALFAPLPDVGILILDEEHEPAYKQGDVRPTYHAREAAIALGRILSIPVVLGSATPAIETYYHAEQGDYQLVELPERVGATLPPVEVIDLRNELHAGNTSIISRRLYSELERVLEQGQQAILFLNRRGAASFVLCRDCGFVAMCDDCDIPMTYHATEHILLCHYCNRSSKPLHICPRCSGTGIRYFGLGTEKVIETIHRSFPTARLLRWDKDTARNHHQHRQLLERFANREADILVGTQMIAKGLDIPGVTLVGVVTADIALNLPDFAAPERAFTLLTQVAGRAGRGEEEGRVIIQTFNPQHFCIESASQHDYAGFYAAEIEARRRFGYPPFRQFVKFTYSHENRRRSQNEALLLREKLDEWIERLGLQATDIVGPAPALMERVRAKYRWQMIARGPDLRPLLRAVDTRGWEVDIDPVSTV